ncbi:hypothetical protein HZB05_02940 [Candidatus Wolfebacteria bacterium]|nr:hypothetical protein [Candidatus Wolfebacteria bacterium]
MSKKASKILLKILFYEILIMLFLYFADSVGAAGAATYTPTYLKGFGGNPAELVVSIYKYALGAVGIVALGAIIYGAILRITSAGNPSQVQEANAWIIGAVSGIALLFGAYLILQTINPKLVDIGEIKKMITPTIPVKKPAKDPFLKPVVPAIDENIYVCETTKGKMSGVYYSKEECTKECSGADKECVLIKEKK